MKVIIVCVSASTLADVPLVIIVKYLIVMYFWQVVRYSIMCLPM